MACRLAVLIFEAVCRLETNRHRLEGMVPNTPATGKLSKSASKRRHQLETPSMTRVKGNIPSSSPDYKSPMRLENQLDSMNAIP